MKLSISSILGLIFGFSIAFLFQPEKKDIQSQTKKEIIETKIQHINKIKNINEVEVLPKFISEDLKNFELNPKEINEKAWNEFLKRFEKNSFEELNALSPTGNVIHYAAKSQSKELILKLLDLGYDINEKDTEGFTPLLRAINKDTKVEFIEFLVNNGAKLTKDALTLALGKNNFSNKGKDNTNEQLVDYLIDNGFTFDKEYFGDVIQGSSEKKDEYLMTIIDSLEINEFLEKEYDPIYKIRNKEHVKTTYLERVIQNTSNDVISYMLNNKVDLKNYENKDQLIFSLITNNNISDENSIKIIEESNYDIFKKLDLNRSLLMTTISAGNVPLSKYLIEKGLDTSIVDDTGKNLYDFIEMNFSSSDHSEKKEELINLLKGTK